MSAALRVHIRRLLIDGADDAERSDGGRALDGAALAEQLRNALVEALSVEQATKRAHERASEWEPIVDFAGDAEGAARAIAAELALRIAGEVRGG